MRSFRLHTDAPLSYSVCGQLMSKDGFLHHKRNFEWNVLILVMEGCLHITSAGIPYTVKQNEYILLKAGEEHFGHQMSEGRLSYLWVHFRAAAPFEIFSDSDEVPGLREFLFPEKGEFTASGRIPLLFFQLMDISLEEQGIPPLMPDYALSLLFMELSLEYRKSCEQQSANTPTVVSAVKEWIKNHYYHPFTVRELANEFGYQADYLSALLKKYTGTSIVQYTNSLRIKMSKNLLVSYGFSVKEAAYSCGFPDEKYYMRLFKSMEGITPTQYKNAFCKKNIN